MTMALSFQSIQFDVVDLNNQPWVRSPQIAEALGYKQANRVTDLYNRNADEFTPPMTQVVTLNTPGGPQETRIFSLRGCHLLAMFSRTSVAKAFRVWVLDVLETLNQPKALPTPDRLSTVKDPERKALNKLVKVWGNMLLGDNIDPGIWPRVNTQVAAHFGKTTVDEMTIKEICEAIDWVQEKIDTTSQTSLAVPKLPNPFIEPQIDIELRKVRDLVDDALGKAKQFIIEQQIRSAGPGLKRAALSRLGTTFDSNWNAIIYALEAMEHTAIAMNTISGMR